MGEKDRELRRGRKTRKGQFGNQGGPGIGVVKGVVQKGKQTDKRS